jgi:hypothetical protein
LAKVGPVKKGKKSKGISPSLTCYGLACFMPPTLQRKSKEAGREHNITYSNHLSFFRKVKDVPSPKYKRKMFNRRFMTKCK